MLLLLVLQLLLGKLIDDVLASSMLAMMLFCHVGVLSQDVVLLQQS